MDLQRILNRKATTRNLQEAGEEFGGEDLILQLKADLKQIPWYRRKLSENLGNRFSDHIRLYGDSIPTHREYRVHVVNGRVVPWSTGAKWDFPRYFGSGRNREIADVERQVQGWMDTLLASKNKTVRRAQLDKHTFGFDVGVGRDGKAKLFEMNPTQNRDITGGHQGSGQLLNPIYSQSIVDQIAGRTPLGQKIQRVNDASRLGFGAAALSSASNPYKGFDT